jgi:subtilisin family serine protease
MSKKNSDKKEKNYKCKLLPYERIDCLSIQDANQHAGWGITAFDLPKAWQYTQGEGVVIAVVDTGCDLDHPDLKDNLLEGINFVKPGTPPEDDNCHGTHCTGILVAENNDIGMVGVCPKAKVMPVKVLNSKGSGNLLDVAKGVVWAADNGADIITMSLGSPMKVQQVRKAIQYAASKGIPTFVAAGNAGNTKEVFYPANYPETIAIGAIDENFNRAKFSNTGRNLDFMAPGVDIFSTVPDNWYATLSGTSMACPFAVGVATLVLSCVKSGKVKLKLETIDDYREVFRKYTTQTPEKYDDPKFYEGFGIIDPRKMMEDFEASQEKS